MYISFIRANLHFPQLSTEKKKKKKKTFKLRGYIATNQDKNCFTSKYVWKKMRDR